MSYFKQNFRYLRNKQGLNQEEFGALFGLSRDNVASYERGVEPRLDVLSHIGKVLHISLDDLLHVDLSAAPPLDSPGELFKEASPAARTAAPKASFAAREAEKKPDKRLGLNQIPLYRLSASGLSGLYHHQEPAIDYLYLPFLPPCDGAVYVNGDHMAPALKSGDIVVFQHIQDLVNGIFFGEMYLVSFYIGKQEFTTVKTIHESALGDAYISLHSLSPQYGIKDIPLRDIKALAWIKASIRINSMA